MAATAAVGAGAALAMPGTPHTPATLPPPALPRLEALPSAAHVGSKLCSFRHLQQDWTVYEHLDDPQGALTLWTDSGMLRLDKRTEPAYPAEGKPYFGMPLAEVAMAEADLLADRLLRDGDPDEAQVRDVAPPPASLLDPKDNGGRWPWTTFVGTREGLDTMPILPNGRSRTSRPEHAFAELGEEALIKRREEGLLGGWMPAVRKVMRRDGEADGWYDVLVFADVRASDRFVVQTWHRTMHVRGGEIVGVHYTHSYPAFAPSRKPATAEQFYAALLDFAAYWQQALDGTVQAQLPDASWNAMAQFAFARELVVRPGGDYPKYGAVERDYYGNEYDGFQDTFTSSLYANLEWGRFAQAAAVLDNYFDEFVQDDGLPNMRGPEVGQFGLTLSLLARYLRYTGDAARLRRLLPKIAATAQLLCELHDQALALPRSAHGHGLLHGWNESDACLFPDPSLWWKPYYANSALTIRGWEDIAQVWSTLGGDAGLAAQWQRRARQLRARLHASLRANVRRDLSPPYVGPLPGTTLTFRQSLLQENPATAVAAPRLRRVAAGRCTARGPGQPGGRLPARPWRHQHRRGGQYRTAGAGQPRSARLHFLRLCATAAAAGSHRRVSAVRLCASLPGAYPRQLDGRRGQRHHRRHAVVLHPRADDHPVAAALDAGQRRQRGRAVVPGACAAARMAGQWRCGRHLRGAHTLGHAHAELAR